MPTFTSNIVANTSKSAINNNVACKTSGFYLICSDGMVKVDLVATTCYIEIQHTHYLHFRCGLVSHHSLTSACYQTGCGGLSSEVVVSLSSGWIFTNWRVWTLPCTPVSFMAQKSHKLYILATMMNPYHTHHYPRPPPVLQNTHALSIIVLGQGRRAASRSQWGCKGVAGDWRTQGGWN